MKRLMSRDGNLHTETDECRNDSRCVRTAYYSVPIGMIGELKAWASRPLVHIEPDLDDPFPWPNGILMERGAIKDAVTRTDITEDYEKWCERHQSPRHPEVLDIIERWENR